MEAGFFPLDDELHLLPGSLTPRLQEALVRLSTHIPSFAKAAGELAYFTGAIVHPDTARRQTIAAGALLVHHETAQAKHILDTHPASPATPDTLVFSVDGAFVPLIHGQWTEVRTLAVGTVQPLAPTPDGPRTHTTNLSYFSRRTDSTNFSELALVELHRRGIEGARRVGAVVDGAAWCQTFIDNHYPEAVRILDFAHASEYITRIGNGSGSSGPLLSDGERAELRWSLKHEQPAAVLEQLKSVVTSAAGQAELTPYLAYLTSRLNQMQYAQFAAEGWPIGSGMVESANKLVVEDRLKGAGMHWAEPNVNPLLALRNAVCNDRWPEKWAVIEQEQRRQAATKRRTQQAKRRASRCVIGASATPPETVAAQNVQAASTEPRVKSPHPWRRAWSIRRQCEIANAA